MGYNNINDLTGKFVIVGVTAEGVQNLSLQLD